MQDNTLKLITLNIWGGHVEKPLLQFIQVHQEVDIFCLQEVYHKAPGMITNEDRYVNLDIFSEIQAALPSHRGYFRPVVRGIYGIGMFIKNTLQVLDEGEVSIHANDNYSGVGPTHSRILQYANLAHGSTELTVANIHGLWNGMGKTDTPERLAQSNAIRGFMDGIGGQPKLLCGDFNLRPDTESLRIIAHGMEDHIRLNDVQSTRTKLYTGIERYADYVFTSPALKVKDFQVLPDEVSDHAPLLVEFGSA